MLYEAAELHQWRGRHYGLLKRLRPGLKRLIRAKLKGRKRPGRRFFGEAFVAAARPGECWYGSFKWLTSPKWASDHTLSDEYQEEFRRALAKHFPELCQFQDAVKRASRANQKKPVGPDLWFITRQGHVFVEVKLPGDRVRANQLQGLRLISKYLKARKPVKCVVIKLTVKPGAQGV